LQAAVGPGFYILVEKILGPDEKLLPWPVSGTTGYEALNLIDGVLVERGAAHALDGAYREASGVTDTFATLLRQARRATLEGSFASELEVLVSDLSRIT
jgi:(1->4)-alpha-D-glucan 1-alpha-D-glucosylmutase